MTRSLLLLALVALVPCASLAATPRPARDCVDPLVVASSTNLFPSQFQIIGSSSVAGMQTEVRLGHASCGGRLPATCSMTRMALDGLQDAIADEMGRDGALPAAILIPHG